ncbi:peptide-methionine (S)-S-oxide reductase MsrA [Patescibacteria group bacterium]|nr:peptide-methionine (S)-S-oxide reductase MsrA [Patescibacteria group bacterium]
MEETITVGGGCFWCLEEIFKELAGVKTVVSGYSGGHTKHPKYDQVCAGETGHAEVVEVTFDPSIFTLADLLRIFFTMHDPTTMNRQGADSGEQYRSIILYRDEKQRETARQIIREIEARKVWDGPIVTQLQPFEAFYPAEGYHQEYYRNNPDQSYCRVVIAPKVMKLRKEFANKLRRSQR